MVQNRNMGMQIVLYVITLSIYGIYWYYVTSKEMVEHKGLNGSPALWTVLMFVPLLSFYSIWKHSEAVDAVTDGRLNKFLILVLWLFLSPVVWVLTQLELNKIASART